MLGKFVLLPEVGLKPLLKALTYGAYEFSVLHTIIAFYNKEFNSPAIITLVTC